MLIEEEWTRVEPQLRDAHSEVLSEVALARLAKDYAQQLQGLGLNHLDARIFVVERLPAPYEGLDAWALTCDSYDEEVFGIKSGIYLRSDKLMPYYTRALIAHEFIHLLIGQPPRRRTAVRWGWRRGPP